MNNYNFCLQEKSTKMNQMENAIILIAKDHSTEWVSVRICTVDGAKAVKKVSGNHFKINRKEKFCREFRASLYR